MRRFAAGVARQGRNNKVQYQQDEDQRNACKNARKPRVGLARPQRHDGQADAADNDDGAENAVPYIAETKELIEELEIHGRRLDRHGRLFENAGEDLFGFAGVAAEPGRAGIDDQAMSEYRHDQSLDVIGDAEIAALDKRQCLCRTE